MAVVTQQSSNNNNYHILLIHTGIYMAQNADCYIHQCFEEHTIVEFTNLTLHWMYTMVNIV